jgi:hypothetical protein
MKRQMTVTDLHAEIDDLSARLEDAHNRLALAQGQFEELRTVARGALAELEAIRGLLPTPTSLPGKAEPEEARAPLPVLPTNPALGIWPASEGLVTMRVRLSMTTDPVSIVDGDTKEQTPCRTGGARRPTTH